MMPYIWLIAGILLFIFETFTADFTCASIALACLITFIPAYAKIDIVGQVVTFSISLIIIFISIRPFVKKIIQGKSNKAHEIGLNTLIGKRGIVSEEIINSENKGHVKIDGDIWKAYSKNGENINIGENVIVKKTESIIIFVEKI